MNIMQRIATTYIVAILCTMATAQQNRYIFSGSNQPSAGHYTAKEYIKLEEGFEWNADDQVRQLDVDWDLITPIADQSIGHNGYSAGYQDLAISSSEIDIDESLPPGGLPGHFSVSENGAANYIVPLEVAPGPQGTVPQLAVAYNSYAEFGQFGFRTSLMGISAIVRVAKTVPRNGIASPAIGRSSDQLILDGVYLKEQSTGYFIPEASTGNAYFVEYYDYGGYRAKFADGTVMIYGSDENGHSDRMDMGNGNSMAFYISKIIKPNGLTIEFSYDKNKGNTLLKRIAYGKAATPSVFGPPAHACHIDIHYSQAAESRSNYLWKAERANNQIITQIECFSGEELFRSYWFDYAQANNTTVLKRISYRGTDGSMTNPTTLGWTAPEIENFEPITTTGENPVDGMSFSIQNISAGAVFVQKGSYCIPARLNDDLYSDIIKVSHEVSQAGTSAKVEFFSGTGTGFAKLNSYTINNLTSYYEDGTRGTQAYFGDFNGDGYTDFMGFRAEREQYDGLALYKYRPVFAESTASGTYRIREGMELRYTAAEITGSSNYGGEMPFICPQVEAQQGISGDFDGDGKMEILFSAKLAAFSQINGQYQAIGTIAGNKGCVHFYVKDGGISMINKDLVRINTNQYPEKYDFIGTLTENIYLNSEGVQVIDIDGDGKQEIINTGTGSATTLNFDDFGSEYHKVYGFLLGDEFPTYNGGKYDDINGDGLIDFVWVGNDGYVHCKINTGSGWVEKTIQTPLKFYSKDIPQFSLPTGTNAGIVNQTERIVHKETSISLADINSDGKLEIIAYLTDKTEQYKRTLLYDPMGTLLTSTPITFDSTVYTDKTVYIILPNGKAINTEIKDIISIGDFSGNGKTDLLIKDKLIAATFNQKDIHADLFIDGFDNWFSINETGLLGKEQKPSSTTIPDGSILSMPIALPAVTEYVVFANSTHSTTRVEYYNPLFKKFEGFMGTEKMKFSTLREDGETVIQEQSKSIAKLQGARINGDDLYIMRPKASSAKFQSGGTISNTTNEYVTIAGIQPGFRISKTETTDQYGDKTTTTLGYATTAVSTANSAQSLFSTFIPKKSTTTKGNASEIVEHNSFGSANKFYLPTKTTATTKLGGATSNLITETTFNGLRPSLVTTTRGSQTSTVEYRYYQNKIRQTTKNIGGGDKELNTETTYDNTYRFPVSEQYTASNGTVFQTLYSYKNGNLSKMTDPNGLVTKYSYDGFGNLTSIEQPDGDVVSISRSTKNDGGFIQTESSAFNGTARTRYDAAGRITNATKPGYNNRLLRLQNTYNDGARSAELGSFYSSMETTEESDKYGRPTSISSPLGSGSLQYSGHTVTKNFATDGNTTTITSSFAATGQLTAQDHSEWGHIGFSNFDALGHAQNTTVFGHDTKTFFSDGVQTSIDDPSAGETVTERSTDGLETKITSEDGSSMTYQYDNLARPTSISWQGGQMTCTYDTEFKGKLSARSFTHDNQTMTEQYRYDQLGRLTSFKETIAGRKEYETQYTYDSQGRVATKTYPNGFVLAYQYQGASLVGIYQGTVADQNLIWKLESTDDKGRITKSLRGNKTETTMAYDDAGRMTGLLVENINNTVIRNYSYEYSQSGSLLSQFATSDMEGVDNLYETYTYDAKDQLASINGQKILYDSKGNITYLPGVAKLKYDPEGNPYAPNQIFRANDMLPFDQDVTYTPWKKIATVTDKMGIYERGRYGIWYGADFQRRMMVCTNQEVIQYWRYYSGDFEEMEQSNYHRREFCYIYSPEGLVAVYVTHPAEPANAKMYYLHTDRIGNIHAITSESGYPEQIRSEWNSLFAFFLENPSNNLQMFNTSAWGVRTWAQTGEEVEAGSAMIDRGFTGHEHLYSVGLINMNGRVYDPHLGKFLSPDPYVQNPLNPLNYNRYAYCLNNPLKYTDPSGEIFGLITAWLAMTESGYEVQKYFSPVAAHLDIRASEHQTAIGFDASLGAPKASPISYRYNYGKSYFFRNYGNHKGWETRKGGELTFFGVVSYAGTTFSGCGYPRKQTTNMITLGGPFTNAKYENDTYLGSFNALGTLGVPQGDPKSDGYKTAAARLKFGSFSTGMILHTGFAPHPIEDSKSQYVDRHGEATVMTGGDVQEESQSHGIFYIGFGSVKIGRDSENIRHGIQNQLAHDGFNRGYRGSEYPWVKPFWGREPEWYYYYGGGNGSTLY